MSARDPSPVPTEAERAVQLRMARLGGPLIRPLVRAALWSLGTAVVIAVVGVALLVLDTSPRVVFGVSLGILVAGITIAWAPFARPSSRTATRLVVGHDCLEARHFTRVTGGPFPRGARAATQWLADHPGHLEAFSVLLSLGRVDDAQRVIDAEVRRTDDDRFADARARATLALARGEEPDLALLESRLKLLDDPREIRHRSACLAMIRAMVAIGHGEDPTPILVGTADSTGIPGPATQLLLSLAPSLGFAVLAFVVIALVASSRLS